MRSSLIKNEDIFWERWAKSNIETKEIVLSSLFSFFYKLILCHLQVFMATDDDATPIICFLLQEQKRLLSVKLQTIQINDDILFDVEPDMSWSIPAIAAEPVAVTRSR